MRLLMRLRIFVCALIVASFTFQAIPVAAFDEGMWTFNNVPREDIKQKYGFEVTDDWLKKVQLASVRFNNGGSGSFVSPDGLVLTNYHIVEDIVGERSEERRVGKECRSRWSPYHEKKKEMMRNERKRV